MRLVAIVLAAGSARRFGSDKLSALLEGEPLLFHAIRAARAAPVERVIVVARPGLETGDWSAGPPVEVLRIESGALSTSLKAGIAAAAQAKADGAFVFLGDMPRIPHQAALALADMANGAWACAPRHEGLPGHPVLLSSRAFDEVARIEGDKGAGTLLRDRDDVHWLDWPDAAICLDVDRPQDLDRLKPSDQA